MMIVAMTVMIIMNSSDDHDRQNENINDSMEIKDENESDDSDCDRIKCLERVDNASTKVSYLYKDEHLNYNDIATMVGD